MKFKVYMKKCLELGVFMILVDDIEVEEVGILLFSWLIFLLCMLEFCGWGGEIILDIF